jgi:hypothetical protein
MIRGLNTPETTPPSIPTNPATAPKQKLIGSILKKYPIPAILLAERDKPGTYEIIDGLQRLHSIVSFIENAFPFEAAYFDVAQFPTAKAAAAGGAFEIISDASLLSAKEVSTILD